MINRITAAIFASLIVSPLVSIAADRGDAERWMTLRLIESAFGGQEGLTKDDARKRLAMQFANADADGSGSVNRADIDTAQRTRIAQARASQVSQILRNDLDGDGRVTRAEITIVHAPQANRPLNNGGFTVEPTAEQKAEVIKQIVAREMKADANGDGVITWQEMMAYAKQTTTEQSSGYGRPPLPASLDSNGDGSISKAEFALMFDRAFDGADSNRDGKLSVEEQAKLQGRSLELRRQEQTAERERREQEQAKSLAERCNLPKPRADAKLAVVGVYEGQGLSMVSLGGDDEEVNVARVTIEDGREPLTLVLTSYSAMVWLIDGNVSRVAQVIASSQQGDAQKIPRVGVVGVPRERVAIAASSECLRRVASDWKSFGESEGSRFAVMLGRKPDYLIGMYGMARISVPSGAVDEQSPLPETYSPNRSGPARDVWAMMDRFNPKGLIYIDPARVVSRLKAARYVVLPQEAGLAQLVESGALEISGHVSGFKIGGTTIINSAGDDRIEGQGQLKPFTQPNSFTIKRQITYPAGLFGAHAVKFVLPAGVPEPLGSPGHSGVTRGD